MSQMQYDGFSRLGSESRQFAIGPFPDAEGYIERSIISQYVEGFSSLTTGSTTGIDERTPQHVADSHD